MLIVDVEYKILGTTMPLFVYTNYDACCGGCERRFIPYLFQDGEMKPLEDFTADEWDFRKKEFIWHEDPSGWGWENILEKFPAFGDIEIQAGKGLLLQNIPKDNEILSLLLRVTPGYFILRNSESIFAVATHNISEIPQPYLFNDLYYFCVIEKSNETISMRDALQAGLQCCENLYEWRYS